MDGTDFAARLLPGERIVWSGAPGRGLIVTPHDVILIPFSLAWCGFTVFWKVAASKENAPFFFQVWGDMFVAIGLYLVFGRFVLDAWIRRRLRYAVTDRRVLIARTGLVPTFTALSLAQLGDVSLHERGDGRGTIRFGREVPLRFSQNMGEWTPALGGFPQLIAIEDVARVYDLIQRHSRSAQR